MEFTNEFTVATTAAETWKLLTDVPRIAPCLPGATVEPRDDGTFAGTVTVKVGPIKVLYRGTARFRERDASALRMVLDATGNEGNGRGSAAIVATVQLVDQGHSTLVRVGADLQITGKVAQFGRSAMADVAARMIDHFAANLESLLGHGRDQDSPAGVGAAGAGAGAAVPPVAGQRAGITNPDALDLATVAGPLVRRALPQVAAFALGAVTMWVIRRRTLPAPTGRAGQTGCVHA